MTPFFPRPSKPESTRCAEKIVFDCAKANSGNIEKENALLQNNWQGLSEKEQLYEGLIWLNL